MTVQPAVFDSTDPDYGKPTAYPYKIEFHDKLNTIGGWFIYWSGAKTTESTSVRNGPSGPTLPDAPPPPGPNGPYPAVAAEYEGVAKVKLYLAAFGQPSAEIVYTCTALDPETFEPVVYSTLELEPPA